MKRLWIFPALLLVAFATIASVWPAPPVPARVAVAGHSSSMVRAFPKYAFIEYDKNTLHLRGDSAGWDRLFARMDQLVFEGDTNLTVLHMGGSHVQAGILSDALRERLFTLAPGIEGERGFLFPYKLAKTNGPPNYAVRHSGSWDSCKNSNLKDHCDWGMSGYNAWTSDTSAVIKLWAFDPDSTIYPFNRVKVFHHQDSTALLPTLDARNQVVNITVDLEAGFTEFELAEPCDTLWLGIAQTDSLQTRFTLQGLTLENDDNGITYHAIGVNGASVPSYLRCEKLPVQLQTLHPDLAIFGIGINDAYKPTSSFSKETFKANYDSLIAHVRAANPDCQLLFLTNNDSYYRRRYANKNAIQVREAMYELAEEHNGAVWDLFEIMGGLGSITAWESAGLAKHDKIHFTKAGYRFQAELMFQAIRERYGEYLQAQASGQRDSR